MTTPPGLHNLRILLHCLHQSLKRRRLRDQPHGLPIRVHRFTSAFLRIPKLANIVADQPIRNEIAHIELDPRRIDFDDHGWVALTNAGARARRLVHIKS